MVRRSSIDVLGHLSLRSPAAFALVVAMAGCVHTYREPELDEPHATVKVRVIHHERTGPELDQAVRIAPSGEEFGLDIPGDGDGMRVVRVRLLPTQYRVVSTFFHTITRVETVFESEQYACGTQQSGSYQTTRYCTRTVPRQRQRIERITDGACEASATQGAPMEGAVYLVQYDYFGNGVCSMTCLRQIDTGGGTFRFVPCGASEPPVVGSSGGEDPAVLAAVPPPPATETPPPTTTPIMTPVAPSDTVTQPAVQP